MSERQVKNPRKRKYSDFQGKSRDITDEEMEDAHRKGNTKHYSQVQKNKQDLRRMKNMCEVKTTVTTVTGSMVSVGAVQSITNLAQGTTGTSRIGSKVKSFSLRISGHMNLVPDVSSTFVRIMIVIDFSQHGVPPTFTDLFQSVTNFRNNGPRDLVSGTSSSFKRLIVLYDEFWILNPPAIAINAADAIKTFQSSFKVWNWYKRVNHYIYYSGVSDADSDMDQGNMYVLSTAGTSARVNSAINIVWKYTDS